MAEDPWAAFNPRQPEPTQAVGGADPWAEFNPKPAPAQASPAPEQSPGFLGTLSDVAQSAGAGITRGAAAIPGIVGDAKGGASWLAGKLAGATAGAPDQNARQGAEKKIGSYVPSPMSLFPSTQDIVSGFERIMGPLYKPKTTAGEYASTIGEFIPASTLGPGSVARNVLGYGVAPAIASETAGQATKGTVLEPFARAGAALGTAGGVAAFSRPALPERMVGKAARGTAEPQFAQAEALARDAQARGIQLTPAEAIQQVTGGGTRLGDMQRVVESTREGGQLMAPFMARRPEQIRGAANQTIDRIAPPSSAPSSLGPRMSDAATAAMKGTPEGQRLQEALWRAGPRTTAEEAGQAIQQPLRNVYEKREGMRAALADLDYSAARAAPATVPMNKDFRFVDATATALDRPGIDIIMDAAARNKASAQWLKDNNARGVIPIIGDDATIFAQVDAKPVVQHLDDALSTAKGAVKQGLTAAKQALMTRSGEIDNTVTGLHNSRVAITDLISQAKQAGANNTVRELEGALGSLDKVLESVPAYGQARKNFQAASTPLAPFENTDALSKAIELDQYSKRLVMPADRVPQAIEAGGASAARAFKEVSPPEARQAFENYLGTRILDRASNPRGDVNAGSLSTSLRDGEDLLRQFPDLKSRLEGVLRSRDDMRPVEQSLLGRVAEAGETRPAYQSLLARSPLSGSEKEVGRTVGLLAKQDAEGTASLLAQGLRDQFDESTRSLLAGQNQFGGAKFVKDVAGNRQQRENLNAALNAIPDGASAAQDVSRLLDVLAATGQRQAAGSKTAFNARDMEDMARGGVGQIGQFISRPFGEARDAFARMRLGSQSEQLAQLLMSGPEGVRRVQELAATGGDVGQIAARLLLERQAASAEQTRSQPVPYGR
jgi:hypothetical protein